MVIAQDEESGLSMTDLPENIASAENNCGEGEGTSCCPDSVSAGGNFAAASLRPGATSPQAASAPEVVGRADGRVMVVGGGIAGMQAALDLAESGYYVYLVERKSAIGGVMAGLDKTFPTNDCAMCTISPKLVDVGRNDNIELLTLSQLTSVDGQVGDFRVRVRREPSYVRSDLCKGCNDCAEACPIERPDRFNLEINKRKAVSRLYPQAVPNTFAIERIGVAGCQNACPAGTSVQGYVALLRAGRYADAYNLILETNPFPSICGRICDHPCESHCRRSKVDEPLAIRDLKRFISDWATENGQSLANEKLQAGPFGRREQLSEADRAARSARKVAIIGAGPAGLTCAARLAAEGYGVTVFDRADKPGGMMRHGIPAFRLPRDVLKREIEAITALGVELRMQTAFGTDITVDSLRADGYEAIFVAAGLSAPRKLNLPGEDAANVTDAVAFLSQATPIGEVLKAGGTDATASPVLEGRVLVLGGGNVAMDVARTALRLGAADVKAVMRESRETMLASHEEFEAASGEGATFDFGAVPVAYHTGADGRVTEVEFQRVAVTKGDDGRLSFEPQAGSNFRLPCDHLILALGQVAEAQLAAAMPGVSLRGNGTIDADPVTLATGGSGIYVGGDVAGLFGSVITAVASGNRAARSIMNQLQGRPLTEDQIPLERPSHLADLSDAPIEDPVTPAPRRQPAERPAAERVHDFAEASRGFSEQDALAEAERCLQCAACSDCHSCVKACEACAINFDDQPEDLDLHVGGIILAPGYELFDAGLRGEYGYGRLPNVLTSMEFERYLSASGPTAGHIVRPSDGREPKRVAFIQCVGSRDTSGCGEAHCSGVCCMYATKEAVLGMDHPKGLEPTIFFIDMRAHGKGYEAYYSRAQKLGVRYVRCMVSSLKEDPATGDILVRYAIDGKVRQERFDMAVLSVGLKPPSGLAGLAAAAGIELGESGFVGTRDSSPVEASRPGILACGTARGPMDIPDSVTDASAAAARLQAMLPEGRWTATRRKDYPPERDVSLEEPRVGVFVCHCGNNIAGVVDVGKLEDYARTLPDVVFATKLLYTCSPDGLEQIKQAIDEHRLNRVVVTSCTVRTHGPIFMEACREAGLNPYLFEMGNIRDQCSWVHADNPDGATGKARRILAAAVGKSRRLKPLKTQQVPIERRALVIGGGVAGMAAALALADQGHEVHLLESQERLGGHARQLDQTSQGSSVAQIIEEMAARVVGHDNITLHTSSTLRETSGFIGNFASVIGPTGGGNDGEGAIEIKHAVTIVATGGQEYRPGDGELGWGHPQVTTQEQLTVDLRDAAPGAAADQLDSVVMIQCVGSRNDDMPSCSRVCCTTAVQNAIEIKRRRPQSRVAILYRDIRTFGFREQLYRQAREAGVIFINFADDQPPQVQSGDDGRLDVVVTDSMSARQVRLKATQVVLSAGIRPADLNEQVGKLLKVPLTIEGFFLEAHIKLRPVDFATEGVFVAGLAHGPKFLEESIVQAQAAAGRAATVLAQDHLTVGGMVSVVDQDRCAACLSCVRNCPYNVPEIRDGVAYIEPAACQGCGVCASECPAKAIELAGFTDEQLLEAERCLLAGYETAAEGAPSPLK